jgi:hypothetical protein
VCYRNASGCLFFTSVSMPDGAPRVGFTWSWSYEQQQQQQQAYELRKKEPRERLPLLQVTAEESFCSCTSSDKAASLQSAVPWLS